MQFRRTKSFLVSLLLGLTGAASLVTLPALLWADAVKRFPPPIEREYRTRAAKATLLTAGHDDPDTVWIGHIADSTAHVASFAGSTHGVKGTPGGYGPYHIGRGPNRIVGGRLGSNAAYNGVWDYDHLRPNDARDLVTGNPDSLMGWWPITCPFGSVGPSNLADVNRPWFCLDYGNQGNYVINQGSPKRTFGVIGYWHRESKGGSNKAWCGLNAENVVTPVDNVTGNPFNSAVLNYQGNNSGRQTGSLRASGTDKNFPGYGSQWDQMLYRDIDLTPVDHTLAYDLQTAMDTRKSTTFNAQAGWFQFDPWGDPLSAGTFSGAPVFISANNTIGHPVDSAMVYVGKPVEVVVGLDNDFKASDGSLHDMYDASRPSDPYHRWFSEVIAIDSYKQLQSFGGNHANATYTFTIPGAFIGGMPVSPRDGTKRVVRLVFRVKTNRGFDDENSGNAGGYTSGGNGAALVDNVKIDATLISGGDFEGANDIDNTSTGADGAFNKWRSTGKPPGVFAHLHDYASLGITDPCGAAEAAIRFCNTYGKAVSPGDHDNSDKHAGGFAIGLPQINRNSHMRQKWFVSPTINMKSAGVDDYNGMGLNTTIAGRKVIFYGDQTYNVFNYPVTGNGFRYVYQGWPSNQPNGVPVWGELRKTFFFNFITTRGCFEGIIGIPSEDQLIRTSNSSGVPDSMRIGFEAMARCYTLPITEAACSPTTGPNSGGTYDNLTVGFAVAPPPPAIALTIWDLFNDAFPVNSTNQIPVATAGNGFDTTSAMIQSGFNQADDTGGAPNTAQANLSVAGDTAIAEAPGDNVRCDLVFRILPGVGNYVTIGNRSSGLVHRVTVSVGRGAAGNVAVAGDTSFWGRYMGDDGTFGTGGGTTHALADPGGLQSGWSANVWNSARMDTLELNEFPRTKVDGNLPLLTLGQYATMYHEQDPKFYQLGIRKTRCFMEDKTVGNPENTNDQRFIRCSEAIPPGYQATNPHHPSNAAYVGEYSVGGTSGISASEFPAPSGVGRTGPAGNPGETYEFTPILPHGLFTPGTHIEYFFRKSNLSTPLTFDMGPDTNYVFPQPAQGSFDYHRWEEFSVLPDRWKDSAFPYGGSGMAIMLVVDLGDRRGEEATWVSVADSTGMTAASRRGAHNGWSAVYGETVEGNVGTNNAVCVRPHKGQAGSMWDFYQVKAGESNVPSGRLGDRYGHGTTGLANPATHGPTQAMLLNFYKTMVWLNSDLAEESIAPYTDESDDDVFLLTQFVKTAGADPARSLPRGLMMLGEDMVNGAAGTSTELTTFFANEMRVTARFDDYRQSGGTTVDVANFNTQIFSISATDGNMPAYTQDTYGVANPCFLKLDVLNAETAGGGGNGQVAARYENTASANSPFTAAVYTNDDGTRDARTYVLGSRLGLIGSKRGPQSPNAWGGLYSWGTQQFILHALGNIWAALNSAPPGAPFGVGVNPGSGGKAFVNFMNLRSDNPMRSGEARIAFGVAKTERVEIKVYDVSGRLVKTLANRIFVGGQEHAVTWDGTNDIGHKVARGVYFYQLRSPSFVSQKKLTVLKN